MDSKLRSPPARPEIVARTALVERLLASPAPIICVVAPPGYGKTTLLAQWSGRPGTQVGWVSADRRDNDPVVLLTYIAAALDRLEPVDPELFQALASPGVSEAGTAVPRLVAVSAMTRPVFLILRPRGAAREHRVPGCGGRAGVGTLGRIAARARLAARSGPAGGAAARPPPGGGDRSGGAGDGCPGGQGAARLGRAREAITGASSLTTAELRLLPLLATHLTLREIGLLTT